MAVPAAWKMVVLLVAHSRSLPGNLYLYRPGQPGRFFISTKQKFVLYFRAPTFAEIQEPAF